MKNKDIRSVALRLLSRRDHTLWELEQKLRRRGFETQEIEPFCEEFSSKGYLNDRRVAENVLSSAVSSKSLGSNRLRHQLSNRGLEREVVDEVVGQYKAQVDEPTVAMQAAIRLKNRGKDAAYIQRYLWRQGFSADTVRKALYFANLDNEGTDS